MVLCFGLVNVSAQTQVPKLLTGGVINDKATSLPKPEYPAAAQAVGAKGTVNVEVVFDEQGNVESATAVFGHPLLRAAAVNAARQAKFSPTQLNGVPVKFKGILIYNFVLDDKDSGNLPESDEINNDRVITRDSNGNTIDLSEFEPSKIEIVKGGSSGGVINGKAISLPKPEYSAAARAVNASGAVVVEVVIDVEGNVTSAQAVSGHPLLRQSAEEAARNAKLRPTLMEGIPVIVRGSIVYSFAPVTKTDVTDVSNEDNSDNPTKTISGGVLNGKATSFPKPAYPAAARAVKASGSVNVAVVIDEQGNVESANAVSGHPLLRAASVEAAKQAKFERTMLSGNPVKVTGILVYTFIP